MILFMICDTYSRTLCLLHIHYVYSRCFKKGRMNSIWRILTIDCRVKISVENSASKHATISSLNRWNNFISQIMKHSNVKRSLTPSFVIIHNDRHQASELTPLKFLFFKFLWMRLKTSLTSFTNMVGHIIGSWLENKFSIWKTTTLDFTPWQKSDTKCLSKIRPHSVFNLQTRYLDK